ncbi:DUF4080 domain-containing protein [Megasphaera paucivorans]|uniref:Radical SAM superfamily enzyme YgiQ, UPF0313 family n=1 Tax=Megasphaera paucivorans TaxID=349095 RepID=A0A1G9S6I0_9FIRM|nr:B12-binding domain-containing radical SAM protein [Megasphaera paucivorans]SDM30365.1 Radical SAM superfamily enzyme YgiQ, UPF0313 family [Megasphaera paucivorans]
MKTLLVTLNAKFIHSSLALRCLKTSCDAAGIPSVVTAEYTINQNVYDILRHMYSFHAQCIGFSCYIWNIEMTYHLIRLIKQIDPAIRILAGGPEVSYTAREVLETCTDIDYVLQGEGEVVLPRLIREWEEGRDGLSLPGVLGRRCGRIAGDESFCEVTPDLDALPFPYVGEDLSALDHKIIYYESSRGCPFHCQYCLSGMSDTVRFRSASKVIGELQCFVAAGVRQVKFVDRTFNCNPRHYLPLLQYMISVQEPVNFHLEIEPGLLTEEDLTRLLQAPKGRIQLEMGIQSTYETTLKAIHRYNDWPRIKHIMEMLLKKETIHLHLDLIVGLPYEDYDHLRNSFNDIYALHPHKLQIGFLKLLKGSGIRRDYPQQYRYDPCGPYEVLATEWLSYEKIQYLKVFEDVFERIYNSGKFRYTLAYLEHFCHDEYMLLYERITDCWIEEKNDTAPISDYNLCCFFWHFLCKQVSCQAHLTVLRELVSLDMLVFFQFRIKPDFLNWQEAERSVTDSLFRSEETMRKYIHAYTFTNWRDIKMRYYLWPVSNETKNELKRYTKMTEGAAYILAEKRRNEVCWQLIPQGEIQ